MNARNPAAIVSGVIVLWDALAARLLLTADESRVYFLGHPIAWECAMRRVGLLCPTCGMTRSIVLTLHGQIGEAWRLAPGAPLLFLGVLLAATALLVSAAMQAPMPRWLQKTGLVYAAAATMIWAGGWVVRFSQAIHAR